MLTRHPWFGPKRGLGWGWTPVSWEGWLVTALSAGAVVVAGCIFGNNPATVYVALGSVAALVIVCLLTGTPPG